jgi:tetratricopeptide (TPR) repeat protein
MIKKFCFILLTLSCVSVFAQTRIAVMPFKNITAQEEHNWLSDGFSESLSTALAQLPQFIIIERSQLEQIVQEQGLQQSALMDESNAIKLGKMLGVKKLVIGSFQIFKNNINVNIRIVDVESGQIDKSGNLANKRGTLDNIFQFQENISVLLVKALGKDLTKEQEKQIASVTSENKGSLTAYKYYIQGWNDYNAKKYDSAIENYEKALELNPKYVDVLNNLGLIYDKLENYQKAIFYYQNALEIKPDYAIAHYNTGLAYYKLKNYSKAIEFYKKAIELKPTYDKALYALGLVYYYQNNYPEAEYYYLKSVEVNPKYTYGYIGLGLIYYYQKRYEKSVEFYGKGLETNPEYTSGYYNIGLSYYKLNDYPNAIRNYKKALQLDPEYANAYHALGLAYQYSGDRQNAIEAYETFLRKFPGHSSYSTVSGLLEKLKKR